MNRPQLGPAICFSETSGCTPTEFAVEYGPLMTKKLASISGEVRNLETRGQKGLAKANITISRVGQKSTLYSLSTNKRGRFQIELQPGVYDLLMSYKGLQDVKIPHFLVPRGNEVDITIKTRRIGAIVVCQ